MKWNIATLLDFPSAAHVLPCYPWYGGDEVGAPVCACSATAATGTVLQHLVGVFDVTI